MAGPKKFGHNERLGSGTVPTGGVSGSDDFYIQRQSVVLDSERDWELANGATSGLNRITDDVSTVDTD